MAILSSTVKLSSDSRYTGGSDMCSRLIRRSSSALTARHDLSSNGLWVIIRYFCSSLVCSIPFQWSHNEERPRPAMLRSTLHRRHLAYPSTTRLCRGNPTNVPTTPETKYDGFSVLIFRARTKTQPQNSRKTKKEKETKKISSQSWLRVFSKLA